MIPARVTEALRSAWSLVPCHEDKKPHVPWKPYQYERATTEQVQAWVEELSPAAWAGVMGSISGTIALDFDGPVGAQTLESLGLEPQVRTGSGGFHVYVVHPGVPVRTLSGKSAKEFGARYPGLDVRGDGGYAIFTGHNLNGEYQQLWPLEPVPFSSLPVRLQMDLTKGVSPSELAIPKGRDVRVPPACAKEDLAVRLLDDARNLLARDGRNDAGLWLACQLRDNNFDRAEAERVVRRYQEIAPAISAKGAIEPYTVKEALSTLGQAYARPPREPWDSCIVRNAPDIGERSVVVTDRQLDDITEECLRRLAEANARPFVFRRGGLLARVRSVNEGEVLIEQIDRDMLRHRLAEVADFVKIVKEREINTYPPSTVCRNILAAGTLEAFPVLEGVVNTPYLRPDGSLVSEAGYDPATGLIYAPGEHFKLPSVPEDPTADEVAGAVRLLCDELLGDFLFTDQASRSNALALLLTPIFRTLIDGCVPLAVVNAPQAGSGKGLLVETASIVARGRSAAVTTMASNGEEMRKRLTALFMKGETLIVLDNLEGPLSSPDLAAAITAPEWEDRVLGKSQVVVVRPRVTWAVTGNNVELAGDIGRRSYLIGIDAGCARPWMREPEEFRHPDLQGWAADNRADLVGAALTLGRAWSGDGRPYHGPTLGGFAQWSTVIGGILQTAGVTGFLSNLNIVYDRADTETSEWLALLETWERARGDDLLTTAGVLAAFHFDKDPWPIPRSLAEKLDRTASEMGQGAAMRKALSRLAGRRFNQRGLRVERSRDSHAKTSLWRVVSDEPLP